jgi:hypothetical protein
MSATEKDDPVHESGSSLSDWAGRRLDCSRRFAVTTIGVTAGFVAVPIHLAWNGALLGALFMGVFSMGGILIAAFNASMLLSTALYVHEQGLELRHAFRGREVIRWDDLQHVSVTSPFPGLSLIHVRGRARGKHWSLEQRTVTLLACRGGAQSAEAFVRDVRARC